MGFTINLSAENVELELRSVPTNLGLTFDDLVFTTLVSLLSHHKTTLALDLFTFKAPYCPLKRRRHSCRQHSPVMGLKRCLQPFHALVGHVMLVGGTR